METRAFSGRYAATSKSSIAWTNAARSMGARAVTILPSVIAGSSMKVAPAFSRSGLMLHQPVARLPRVRPASERTHGPWQIAAIGCDAVGVDWTTDLAAARKAVDGRVALQGNLDPSALFAPPEALRAETRRVLDSYGVGPGHVFNLGHGITPDVDPERVAVLVDAVRNYAVT